MSEKKTTDLLDSYMAFFKQANEMSIDAFSKSADIYNQFVRGICGDITGDSGKRVSDSSLDELKEVYKNTLVHLKQMGQIYGSKYPGYQEIAEKGVDFAEKGFDVCALLFSTGRELVGDMTKNFRENLELGFYLISWDVYVRPEKFFKKYSEAFSRGVDSMTKNPALEKIVSKLTVRYADFLRSGIEFQKEIYSIPFVTKKEFSQLVEDVKDIKVMLKENLSRGNTPSEDKKTEDTKSKGK